MAVQSLTVRFLGDAKHLTREVSSLKKTLRFSAVAAGAAAATLAIGGIAKVLGESAGAAIEFEAEMSSVYSLMGGASQATRQRVAEDVRVIAKGFGIDIPTAARMAYDAISNGVSPDQLHEFTTAVGKTATGVGSSLDSIGKLFLVTKANFQDIAEADIGNVIANAVKYGAANGEQMAKNLGDILALSKGVGMSFGDAAMAYSALVGTSGAEGAKTQLGAVLSAITNKSTLFAKIGISADSVGRDGVIGTVRKLQAAIGRNPVKLNTFFADKEAKLGYQNLLNVLPLIAKGVQGIKFDKDTLALMFGEKTDNLRFQTAQLRSYWHDIGIQIGTQMVPSLKEAVEKLKGFADRKEDIAEIARLAGLFATAMVTAADAAARGFAGLARAGNWIGDIIMEPAESAVAKRNKIDKAVTKEDVSTGYLGRLKQMDIQLSRAYFGDAWNTTAYQKETNAAARGTERYRLFEETKNKIAMARTDAAMGEYGDIPALLKTIAENTRKVKAE